MVAHSHNGLYLEYFQLLQLSLLFVFLEELRDHFFVLFLMLIKSNLLQKCVETLHSDKPKISEVFFPSLLQAHTFKI